MSVAVKNPRKIDNNLKCAQEARRVLDRLVGYHGKVWFYDRIEYKTYDLKHSTSNKL